MRIRIVTEGALGRRCNAPSVTSRRATRHLPRLAGEEKGKSGQAQASSPDQARY